MLRPPSETPTEAPCRGQVLARRLHFNTFGGNPVCSAGGRAVLRAVDDDGLQANCLKVGVLGALQTVETCRRHCRCSCYCC